MLVPGLRAVVLVTFVILAGACKSDDPGRRDPAIAAGDVREVTGTVTAMRDNASRALTVGDVVTAGDRVTTGSDGEVVIELRHNHVRWRLGPDQAKTPMEAVAWSAPPPTAAEISGDRTAVAGRHAEREAADTAAAALRADVDEAPRKAEPTKKKQKEKKSPDVEPTKPGDTDLVQPMGGGGGSGSIRKSDPPKPADSNLPESIDRDMISAAMDPVKPKLVECGEAYPDAPAKVRVKVKVAASGSVSAVTMVDEVDEELGQCVEAAIKKVKFAATAKGGNFTYPASVK